MRKWPSIVVFVVGCVLIILGGILGWVVFPPLINQQIIESVELAYGTEQYERWEKLSFPLKFKVSLFEVTNPEVVRAGGKPVLQEKGPYVYNQYREKKEVILGDGTLEYVQEQRYEFDPEDSMDLSDEDEITVLNLPYHAIIQTAEDDSFSLSLINANSRTIFGGQDVFLTTKVKNLLFDGVPLCFNLSTSFIPCREIANSGSKNMRVESLPNNRMAIYFSVFNHKNNNNDGTYKIDTGEKDVMNVGKILEFEGSSVLKRWRPSPDNQTTRCDMINGTDSSIYAPFVRGRESMDIFSSDICRSVKTHYAEDRSYMGINGMMFKTMEDMLPAPSDDDGTGCFCVGKTRGILQDGNNCMRKGAMELINCVDSHLVLTMPHLLMADSMYQDGVDGLNPEPEKHQTFVIVEPNSGAPLSGGKRVQFNIFSRKIDRMVATNDLKTTLFPILWIDEGINLPEDLVEMLKDKLLKPLQIVEIIKWVLVGVGIAMAVAGIIWFIIAMCQK